MKIIYLTMVLKYHLFNINYLIEMEIQLFWQRIFMDDQKGRELLGILLLNYI